MQVKWIEAFREPRLMGRSGARKVEINKVRRDRKEKEDILELWDFKLERKIK